MEALEREKGLLNAKGHHGDIKRQHCITTRFRVASLLGEMELVPEILP